MTFNRSDTVLVNYPFASGAGSKIRPALIVQCDRNNSRLQNTVIVQITSRTQHAQTEPTQLMIRAASSEGKQAGLIMDSSISCENLFTIRQDAIVRKIGSFSANVMQQVNACLKAALDLP